MEKFKHRKSETYTMSIALDLQKCDAKINDDSLLLSFQVKNVNLNDEITNLYQTISKEYDEISAQIIMSNLEKSLHDISLLNAIRNSMTR